MHIRTSSYAVWAGVALVTGCAEWPRFDHLPSEGGSHATDTPPGALVSVAWSEAREPEPDPGDQPNADELLAFQLAPGQGVWLRGTLDGLGWSDVARPRRLTDLDCPDAEGSRSPLDAGDYLGDVDPVIVEVTEAATLCAGLELEIAEIGWDLAAFPADACRLPGPRLEHPSGEPLGLDLGGARGGWGVVVEPGRYVVQLAAYDPYDLDAQVPYTLGLSVVPAGPGGQPSLCPLLPQEAP